MSYHSGTVSSRVPPSGKPPAPSGNQPASRVRRGTRPVANLEKPKPIKAGGSSGEGQSTEAQLWGGVDMDRSLEMSAKVLEDRLAEQTHAEAASAEEAKEAHADVREANEREEKIALPLLKGWEGLKSQMQKLTGQQAKPPVKEQQQAPVKPQASPAQSSKGSSGASHPKLSSVGPLPTMLTGKSATERPPDAFALLREAKDKGQLFTEDSLSDGHSEDREDPALRQAVEECIRLCFGLRGILRIGPGRNEQHEPIIVVSTSHGFSDLSLAKVPERVHQFPTLIAIPFDLLPLKRER